MLTLAFSDIHSSIGKFKDLKERVKGRKIDLALFCGDFTNEGSLKVAEELVNEIDFCPLLAIPGNQDSKEIVEMLESRRVSLHKKILQFNKFSLIGIGGGKPVHTFYRLNVGELEAEKFLNNAFAKAKPPVLLVSHTPAAGTRLEVTNDRVKLGLKALRSAVEKFQPLLLVHGHVHEAFGEEKLGRTLCVNTGAVKDGKAVFLEISKNSVKVERLEF